MAAWRTVKVFVSSTFLDMHFERDHLVRNVFPRLAEDLAQHRIHLVPVDLRWGVTEEDSRRALDVCMDALEDCRPFFLGLIGGRYGWTPLPTTLSVSAGRFLASRTGGVAEAFAACYRHDPSSDAYRPRCPVAFLTSGAHRRGQLWGLSNPAPTVNSGDGSSSEVARSARRA